MIFPTVQGSNLLRQKVTLPNDLQGELNVLFIAFQQWQQMEVDSWMPFIQELEQTNPTIYYYELPTIQRMNWFSQKFINEGMRAGIPNPKIRQRTITLYLNKDRFRKELTITDEEHITVLLVNQIGEVLWRSKGPYTKEEAHSLENLLSKHLGT